MAAAGKKGILASPNGDGLFAYFAMKRKDDHDFGKW